MKFKISGDYFFNQFHLNFEKSDETFLKKSPADTDLALWEAPITYSHVEKVVESATHGFNLWKRLSFEKRIEYLKRYQEQIVLAKEQIAEAIALETGKPLWEALTEANSLANKIDVTISDSLPRIKNIVHSQILPNTRGEVFYRPLGPALIIGPFNFPCHLANGQIVSALLAGNSIIFKPSEKTSYSAQLLIDCFHRSFFPMGVINLIHGGGETSTRLIKEKSIKGIYFTGSKEVGLKILAHTHSDLTKLVALELGGKNASIVHHDCNIEHTLTELINACFLTAGQRCTSTSIVLIHRKIRDVFIEQFHNLAKRLIVDHPINYEKEPFMGPLIDEKATDSYLLFMGMAKREGAEELMRGKLLSKKFKGYYVSPSIHLIERPNPKSLFLQSEIFGPNCTFIPYDSIDDAITIANMTEYGLASSIFTHQKEVQQYCLENIEAGLININRSTVGASPRLPFGGIKNSGNYRPAASAMIDSCAYSVSGLTVEKLESKISNIKGLI